MSKLSSIAFVCHPYHRGGVTRWMADAALAYDRQGVSTYFITIDPVKEFFSAKGRETLLQLLGKETNNIHIIKAKAGSEFEFGTPQYRIYVYAQLIEQLPAGTPLILADDDAVWQAAVSLYRTYPLVGVLHADEAYYYSLAKKYHAYLPLLACVSERISRTVIKDVPALDPARLPVIPCGINLPAIDMTAAGGNKLQLVYVGRVSEYQKRTSDLIKIAALLKGDDIDFHLNIIGDGNAKTGLENKVKELGLDEFVSFPGWLSQQAVAGYLAAADILLLTSDFEGTPIAMMEAVAAGCGMVGTRVSGIEDYELHPQAADCLAVYTVGDIAEAVSKIKKLSAIPTTVRKQAARTLAETEFSMDVCLQRYSAAIATMKPAKPVTVMQTPGLSFFESIYSRALATARYLKVTLTK